MYQRMKFIVSALIFLVICILFFVPVINIENFSIKIIDFISHYLDTSTKSVNILAQQLEITQILRIHEFFIALIFGSVLISLLMSIIFIFIPNNKSAIVTCLTSLIGFIIALLVINNIFLIITLGKIDAFDDITVINKLVPYFIIILIFAGSFLNFVITRLKQPEPNVRMRKMGVFTNFFLRKRKFGTTKLTELRPEDETEIIAEQNLQLLMKNDEIKEKEKE